MINGEIGLRLRELRKNKGYTQEQFSEEVFSAFQYDIESFIAGELFQVLVYIRNHA